jgi:hypothetical protein
MLKHWFLGHPYTPTSHQIRLLRRRWSLDPAHAPPRRRSLPPRCWTRLAYGRLLLLTCLPHGAGRRNWAGLQRHSRVQPSPSVSVVACPVVTNAPTSAHPVPTLHAVERGLVVVGPAAPVSTDAPGLPSPLVAAPAGLVDQALLRSCCTSPMR